jgi:cytochrome c-type biogenesis protein CcmH/NrfG
LIFLGHADAAIMDGAGAQRLDAEHAFAYRRMPEVSAPAPRPAAPSLPRRPPPPRAAPVAATPPAPPLAANAAAGALDEDLLATAQAAADEGDLDAARRSLRAHLARHPQDPKAHALDGCIELSRNDHAQAERSFTKVVYLEPSNALALLSLAALADRRGDAGAAQRFRERASRSGTEAIRE